MAEFIEASITLEKGKTAAEKTVFPLEKRSIIIGRVSANYKPDVIIEDNFLSRRHAEISYRNEGFVIRDLRSTNGTQLDGKILQPSQYYPLKNGSLIELAIISGQPRILLRYKESGYVELDDTTRLPETIWKEQPHPEWLQIDEEKKEVQLNGKIVILPKKEYSLLLLLFSNQGKVCSRDDIIAAAWSEVKNPDGVSNESVDQLVHRLRNKIELNLPGTKHIINKRGFGYILE